MGKLSPELGSKKGSQSLACTQRRQPSSFLQHILYKAAWERNRQRRPPVGWDQGSLPVLSSAGGGALLPSGPQGNHGPTGRKRAEWLPEPWPLLTSCSSPRILATGVPIATRAPAKGPPEMLSGSEVISVATETSLAKVALAGCFCRIAPLSRVHEAETCGSLSCKPRREGTAGSGRGVCVGGGGNLPLSTCSLFPSPASVRSPRGFHAVNRSELQSLIFTTHSFEQNK